MRVMLINIDSVIPNLAMEKIKLYHQLNGDEVIENLPMLRHTVDRIYASCVFTKNSHIAEEWDEYGAIVGGSGYDVSIKLPEEIDCLNPKINMWFVTRGCNRNCEFCIVPQKEGRVHKVAELSDIWDGKAKKVTLLDNNILFDKKVFFEVFEFAYKNGIKIDFNQVLDHRLLDDGTCACLKLIKDKELRFAFDHPDYKYSVKEAIDMLDAHKLKWNIWYVLVGFNTTFEEDLQRLNYLKRRKQRAFVMRCESCHYDKKYILLASWANQRHMFAKMTYKEFCMAKYGQVVV